MTEPLSPETEQGKKSFMARDFSTGDPITHLTQGELKKDIWKPGFSSERPQNVVSYTSDLFTFSEKPSAGKSYEFFGKYYKVVEPKFPHLQKTWGENSVFVAPITEEEYKKLTNGGTD